MRNYLFPEKFWLSYSFIRFSVNPLLTLFKVLFSIFDCLLTLGITFACMSSGGLRGNYLSNYQKSKCGVERSNTLHTPPLLIHDVGCSFYFSQESPSTSKFITCRPASKKGASIISFLAVFNFVKNLVELSRKITSALPSAAEL